MTQEEKARAYNEVLEKAKEIVNDPNASSVWKEWLRNCFPELKRPDDEKIREELIDHINNMKATTISNLREKQFESWIAWLERQGEQKYTQKDVDNAYLKGVSTTKRMFEKQGYTNETINRDGFAQSVLRGAAINLITWIDYNAAEGNMCLSNMECKSIEDSLVNGDWDKIYAYMKKKLEKQSEQKSQRTISAEAKEALFDYENANMKQKDFAPNDEQKPAEQQMYWTEEEIEPIISDYLCEREHYGGMIGRLCHLKPKQKQTEWGEDDEAFLDDILCKLEHDLILNKDEKDWLKSLKDRVQPKQECSEENEKRIANILSVLSVQVCWDGATGKKMNPYQKEIDWLKSLRPQNRWKPSDEQMMALLYHCSNGSVLTSLYNDLKKLKEE